MCWSIAGTDQAGRPVFKKSIVIDEEPTVAKAETPAQPRSKVCSKCGVEHRILDGD
jgi:hypothetical protein